jgi:hypothetical protein
MLAAEYRRASMEKLNNPSKKADLPPPFGPTKTVSGNKKMLCLYGSDSS